MNLQKMLQDAARQLQKKTAEFEQKVFEFNYKDLVQFDMTGKGEIQDLKINLDLIDKDDPETLQDVLTVAINSAKKDIDEKRESIQNNLAGSMPKGFF